MTVSKEAYRALRSDLALSRAIKAWDAQRTARNARVVLDILLDPETLGTMESEVVEWNARLAASAPG